jgi:hypothetical protein
MKKIILQVLLWVVIAALAYLCVMSIRRPINFNKIKKQRYANVIQRLKDIRTAQVAYKAAHDTYTGSFDTLISFVKNDSIKFVKKIGSLTDQQLEAGMTEREAVRKGIIIRDTMKVCALDTLFGKNYKIENLRYVPYTKKQDQFKLAKGEIKSASGLKIQVFEASVRNFVIFRDILEEYETELKEYNGEKKRLGKFLGLKVGSIEEANYNTGNWE